MKTSSLWVVLLASVALYVNSAMSWHANGYSGRVALGEALGMTGFFVSAGWLALRVVRARRLPRP